MVEEALMPFAFTLLRVAVKSCELLKERLEIAETAGYGVPVINARTAAPMMATAAMDMMMMSRRTCF